MFRTQRNFPIGEWRVVENFKVSKAGGKYRPTGLYYKISITSEKVFTGSDYRNDRSFLSLTNFDELSKWLGFLN